MAYSDFTLPDVLKTFALRVDTSRDLFADIPPVPLGQGAALSIRENRPLASLMATEKGRSELLVVPVLADVWRQSGHRVSLFSGVELNVEPAAGLNGVCDYLLTRGPQIPIVSPPVLVVVEAKRDDITSGYGQCAAEMVAARELNRREKTGVEVMYGCITTGAAWKFLTLREGDLAIDLVEYSISQHDKILGILLTMVGHHPASAAAA